MYCPKCGEFIPEDMSFCPKCHYQYLPEEQKTIVINDQNPVKNAITDVFRSKCFLALSIILIIIGSFYILSIITSTGILQLVANVLGAVLTLTSGVNGLHVYKKKKDLDTNQIQKINYFNHYNYIMGIVGLVLMCILLFLYLIFLFILGFAVKLRGNDSIMALPMFVLYSMIIMIILVGGLGITFIINYFIAWKKMKQYYDTLATTIKTGEYKPVKRYPYVRLFVIGGIIIFFAIMEIAGIFISLNFLDVLKEFGLTTLKDAANANSGDYIWNENGINILFMLLKIALLLGLIKVVINLLTASYMIISAIFFKNIHQSVLKAQANLDATAIEYSSDES